MSFTDRRTDGRMDGQGESSIPPSNFVGRGDNNFWRLTQPVYTLNMKYSVYTKYEVNWVISLPDKSRKPPILAIFFGQQRTEIWLTWPEREKSCFSPQAEIWLKTQGHIALKSVTDRQTDGPVDTEMDRQSWSLYRATSMQLKAHVMGDLRIYTMHVCWCSGSLCRQDNQGQEQR